MSLSLFPEINSGNYSLLDVPQSAARPVAVHLMASGTDARALCGKAMTASTRAASHAVVNLDHPNVCPLCYRAARVGGIK